MGAPALTTRGMKEPEFRKIAEFMDRAVQIALGIQQTSGKMLKDFVVALEVIRLPPFHPMTKKHYISWPLQNRRHDTYRINYWDTFVYHTVDVETKLPVKPIAHKTGYFSFPVAASSKSSRTGVIVFDVSVSFSDVWNPGILWLVQGNKDVSALADEVVEFAQKWPMPGFEASELKFKKMA